MNPERQLICQQSIWRCNCKLVSSSSCKHHQSRETCARSLILGLLGLGIHTYYLRRETLLSRPADTSKCDRACLYCWSSKLTRPTLVVDAFFLSRRNNLFLLSRLEIEIVLSNPIRKIKYRELRDTTQSALQSNNVQRYLSRACYSFAPKPLFGLLLLYTDFMLCFTRYQHLVTHK